MRWMVVASALSLVGCAGVQVMRQAGGESSTMHRQIGDGHRHVAAVSVPLCDLCSTPWDYQTKAAEERLHSECGGADFSLVEEGTSISANSMTYVVPMGTGLVAGTTQARTYYWVAKCVDAADQ